MQNVINLKTPHDITDADFTAPSRSVALPPLPEHLHTAVGSEAKNILITQRIFEKNKNHHPDVTPADSRQILDATLNYPDLAVNDKPQTKTNYWVLVKVGNRNAVSVIDIDPSKKYNEVVGWWWIREKYIDAIKRKAINEGGQVLITSGGAADLSVVETANSHSKGTTNNSNRQKIELNILFLS